MKMEELCSRRIIVWYGVILISCYVTDWTSTRLVGFKFWSSNILALRFK